MHPPDSLRSALWILFAVFSGVVLAFALAILRTVLKRERRPSREEMNDQARVESNRDH